MMATRRDMSGAEFRRALENQEFKADLGLPWYCSTREGTDRTVSYGAVMVLGRGLQRRETIRRICADRTQHEKKRPTHVAT